MKAWPMKPLHEIADVEGGSTPRRDVPEYWNGSIPWATPTDLPMPGEGIANISDTKDRISDKGLASCSAKYLPVGTVLYSSRATIGKIAIADVPLTTNQGFANLVPHEGIDSRFLAYSLWFFTPQIETLAGSTTFREVSRGNFRRFKIPVPPLDEQQRIVRILDEAEALRQLRARADERMAEFIPALFNQMFGDPAKAQVANLGSVCTRITKGESPGWQGFAYCDEGPLFVTSENVLWGALDISSPKRIPVEFHAKLKRSQLKPRDVLINLVGASIGRCCIVPMDTGEANINQAVAVITPSEELTSEYLSNYLLSSATQRILHGGKVESARANISLTDLNNLSITLPPLSLQREFAARVAEARAMQDQQARSRVRLEAGFQAVLHKAFNGEL
jgi:type I restriction enzyme, S subunit